MRTFLVVAGLVWIALAWVMLLSLARAARRDVPLCAIPPEEAPAAFETAGSEEESSLPAETQLKLLQ